MLVLDTYIDNFEFIICCNIFLYKVVTIKGKNYQKKGINKNDIKYIINKVIMQNV